MKRPRLFPGIIFAFIGLNFCVVGVTVYFATGDQSFAVEPQYYQKAVAWDQIAEQSRRSRELGWTARVELSDGAGSASSLPQVRVHLADARGEPLAGASVDITAFANVAAAERQQLRLREDEAGVYVGEIVVSHAGIWEFRIEAVNARGGGERFVSAATVEVFALDGGRP